MPSTVRALELAASTTPSEPMSRAGSGSARSMLTANAGRMNRGWLGLRIGSGSGEFCKLRAAPKSRPCSWTTSLRLLRGEQSCLTGAKRPSSLRSRLLRVALARLAQRELQDARHEIGEIDRFAEVLVESRGEAARSILRPAEGGDGNGGNRAQIALFELPTAADEGVPVFARHANVAEQHRRLEA